VIDTGRSILFITSRNDPGCQDCNSGNIAVFALRPEVPFIRKLDVTGPSDIGADIYAPDAASAAQRARQLMQV